MGRPQDPLLKRFHRLLKSPEPSFHHGMDTESGRQKRATWLDICKQLRRVQRVATGSVQRAPGEQERLLSDVRTSIVDAVSYLIEGDEYLEDDNLQNEETTKHLRVWSSPQNARLAIIQEAIALAHSRRDAPLAHHNKPPLIILICDRHEESRDENHETKRRNFLDSWSSTCYGVGEVLTIQADSSEKVRDSVHHLFDGFTQSDMFPVLMVIYASQVSHVTSDISSVKDICKPWNVRLCVEGPALAMLAQSNRPSDSEECAAVADVILLDPASWFGFRLCAFVSCHKVVRSHVLREFKDHYSRLLSNSINHHNPSTSLSLLKDYDEPHGLATAPILNLWTVLSRVGLKNMRNTIDSATVLAECLVANLRDSPNIVTVYHGIGCVVRISYALSREDRLLPKDKSQEHVSLVNEILFASLRKESEALRIQQSITTGGTCLQFAPTMLLSSGTLWIPPLDMVGEYSKKLQDTVDKYESCRAGSFAFRACVAKCHEIRFVEDLGGQPELQLCFGAFRIVPVEVGEMWNTSETSIETVEALTTLVAKELTESPHEISTAKYVEHDDMEEARALAEQFNRNPGCLRPSFFSRAFNRRMSFPHGYGGGGPLPFDVFLHSDSESRFHDFMAIEPREKCKPVHAVNQAAVASDLVIACVKKIMELWRAGEITLPLKSGDTDESIAGSASDVHPTDAYIEMFGLAEEEAQSGPNRESISDRLGLHDTHAGSEVSYATRNSGGERFTEDSQEYGREVEPSNLGGRPSASSGRNCEHETRTGPQIVLQGQVVNEKPARENNHDYILKKVLSVSMIEKSPRGTKTDEETISSDYILPSAAKTLYPVSSGGASKTSEPVSAVDEVPMVQAENGRTWFGSWRTRGWHNQYDNRNDESSSSTSSVESPGDSESESQNEDSYENEEEAHKSDSSESETASDDHGSNDERDETSEDTDRSDDNENEDSTSEGSSSETNDVTNEHVALPVRRKEESRSVHQSHTSRLLSWIRRGKTQSQLQKPKQNKTNPSAYESDSEFTSSSSQSDPEERETDVNSSGAEEESVSDSDLSSSVETESVSEENSMTDKTSRESARSSHKYDESRSESESSEMTEVSNESDRDSSRDETSDSSDSRRDVRKNETRRSRNEEDSSTENSSVSDDDTSSNDKTDGGQSFLGWALPSWATTPPRLGKRTAPIRGVNSRLRLSQSSESSTDTDSEESRERTRRTTKERNPTSYVGAMWSHKGKSSSNRNRSRRTRR